MTTTTDTKTLTNTSTVDSLIGGYRAHVLGRVLPTPASLLFHVRSREVSIQPEGGLKFALQLGNMLVWAYTLGDVTAEWCHTDSNRLHVSINGRTQGGVRIQVYGGCAFAESLGLVALELGESESVTLDELYAFAGLLREAQDAKGES